MLLFDVDKGVKAGQAAGSLGFGRADTQEVRRVDGQVAHIARPSPTHKHKL